MSSYTEACWSIWTAKKQKTMSSWSRTQNVGLTFLTMTSSPYLNRVWERRLIKITFACSRILAELSLFSCQKKISGSFEFLLSFSRPWWLVKRNMACQHWKVKRVEDWFYFTTMSYKITVNRLQSKCTHFNLLWQAGSRGSKKSRVY